MKLLLILLILLLLCTSSEQFGNKNLKEWGEADYIYKENNYYVKKYKNLLGYDAEKRSYLKLQNEPHFPKLIDYDDVAFILKIEDVGNPIKDYVPNWKQQLNEIKNSLQKHNIIHNDIYANNFVEKDGIIYLIDFEYAIDKNNEWETLKHRNKTFSCPVLPAIKDEPDILSYLLKNNCQ